MLGEQLPAGESVLLPAGTLLVAVDRRAVGVAVRRRDGQYRAPQDATVTVYLAGPGGLEELWTRHFKSARNAVGATTMKILASLREEHPSPAAGEQVVQRPNDVSGPCRWCGGHVSRGQGHQSSPQDTQNGPVEHWQTCPHRRAEAGQVCTVCGRPVIGSSAGAYAEFVREPDGTGRWETRHAPYRDCAHNPQPTPQDLQTRRAEERAAAERARGEEQRRAAERARAQEAEEEAVRAEDEEVAAFLARAGAGAADAAAAVRALSKPLRDGRRFALYLVPAAGRPGDWEMVALIAGRIAGDPFARRPRRNTGPPAGPGITHVQPLPPAPGGQRQAVGLTEPEFRRITTAVRDWEQRPARALRAAVPGAPTWQLDLLLDRPPVGVIVHDSVTGRDGIVLSTRARRVEEDGWSFGLMAEEGWLYVATLREPTPAELEHAERFEPR